MCWAGNGSASQGSGTRTTAGVSTIKELGTNMIGSHGECGSTRQGLDRPAEFKGISMARSQDLVSCSNCHPCCHSKPSLMAHEAGASSEQLLHN